MGAADCDALAAEILAAGDTPACRRLVLDAWAAPDRPAALRCLLGWVRDYAAAGRALALRGGFCEAPPAGEARGPCERPAGVGCWWLGASETKAKVRPAMGFCEAGEKLPVAARFWCAEGQGYWFRLPQGG